MALPPPSERTKRPPKGKSKSRRYAVCWVPFQESSADEDNFRYHEVSSTSVQSAHTALLKKVKEEFNKPDLKKNQLVLIEVVVIQRGQTLESTMGLVDEDDEEE